MVAEVVMAGVVMASAGVQWLERPGGKVAYEVLGASGPWVVAVPGLGDLRQQYRFLVEPLVAAGNRVVLMDLRGLGDSTAAFPAYGPREKGEDVVALLDALDDAPVLLLGNSMAAASATWAAAERPGRVAGVVMLGPFARDVEVPFFKRVFMDVALARPWGPAVWKRYHASLFPVRQPPDMDAHQAKLAANVAEPGRWDAVLAMVRAPKAPCAARLPEVKAPVMVVMGTADPDFENPAVEAAWVGNAYGAEVLMVEGAGHYPHVDSVDVVVPAITRFARRVLHGAAGSDA